MKVIVGIDEAGYGPTLGPFVFGLSVFRVPAGKSNLFHALRGLVRRHGDALDDRLIVDDSKLVYAGRRDLGALERGALAFLAPGRALPRSLEEVCAEPASGGVLHGGWPAWYGPRETEATLPLQASYEECLAWRARATEELARLGIELLECRVEPVLEERWNESLDHTGNKAQTLLEFLAPLLRRLSKVADDDLEIRIDRLGGRRYYSSFLAALFPFRPQRTLCEGPDLSAYRITDSGRQIEISFEIGGDARHLPIALSSMCAKYVREVFLRRLNRYFAERRPGIRPTAGYPEDAARFLDDLGDLLDAPTRRRLVRAR